MLMTPQQARELARATVAMTDADEAEVLVSADSNALTRFANNRINQNVAEDNTTVGVRAVLGKRVGVASTNRLDAASLQAACDAAVRAARVAPEDSVVSGTARTRAARGGYPRCGGDPRVRSRVAGGGGRRDRRRVNQPGPDGCGQGPHRRAHRRCRQLPRGRRRRERDRRPGYGAVHGRRERQRVGILPRYRRGQAGAGGARRRGGRTRASLGEPADARARRLPRRARAGGGGRHPGLPGVRGLLGEGLPPGPLVHERTSGRATDERGVSDRG